MPEVVPAEVLNARGRQRRVEALLEIADGLAAVRALRVLEDERRIGRAVLPKLSKHLVGPIVDPGQERGGGRALSRLAVNPGTLTTTFASAPLRRQADLDAYLAGMRAVPATMKAYEVRLQAQVDHGVALPTEELRLVLPPAGTFPAVSNPS